MLMPDVVMLMRTSDGDDSGEDDDAGDDFADDENIGVMMLVKGLR